MSWELRLGDCLDPVTGLASLADKSVDHVICDPPYEAEVHASQRRYKATHGEGYRRTVTKGALDFAAMTEETRAQVAHAVAAKTKGWALFFCQPEAFYLWRAAIEQAGGKWARAGAWVKPGGVPCLSGDRPGVGYEGIAIAWFGVGRMKWNGGGKAGAWEFLNCQREAPGQNNNRLHPSQKPESLMEALIRDFTNHGDLVCDPFAGSATTGVAAVRMGRRFIGWEREATYHAIARRRLSAAREQLAMFGGAA